MAIETTPLGFLRPDGNELVRNGDNAISANADVAEAVISRISGRLGQAEVNIQGGLGDGPGILEDDLHPGTYFITGTSAIVPDPTFPGFYLIGA